MPFVPFSGIKLRRKHFAHEDHISGGHARFTWHKCRETDSEHFPASLTNTSEGAVPFDTGHRRSGHDAQAVPALRHAVPQDHGRLPRRMALHVEQLNAKGLKSTFRNRRRGMMRPTRREGRIIRGPEGKTRVKSGRKWLVFVDPSQSRTTIQVNRELYLK